MRDTGSADPTSAPAPSLPDVPYLRPEPPAAVSLMDLAPDRLDGLLSACTRHYGRLPLTLGDRATWSWLVRTRNPYLDEIGSVRSRLGRPGAVMLNMSYEWSCTVGVGPDPDGEGVRMLRTLDWPLPGLGRNIVVARQTGPSGPFYNVTWPGYVGVLTGMAPGRFAAAINQPPMRRHTRLLPIDWLLTRAAVWRNANLPPAHLLRRVFDDCRTYAEAREALIRTPICLPAFFSLSGCAPGEACVIERWEDGGRVHDGPGGITNHWLDPAAVGHDRGNDSPGRLTSIHACLGATYEDFAWLVPPILNPTTRLAVVANAAREELVVQGWERDGAATGVFSLRASRCGDTPRTSRAPGSAASA